MKGYDQLPDENKQQFISSIDNKKTKLELAKSQSFIGCLKTKAFNKSQKIIRLRACKRENQETPSNKNKYAFPYKSS